MDFSVNHMEPENLNTLQAQSCLKDTLLLLLLLHIIIIITYYYYYYYYYYYCRLFYSLQIPMALAVKGVCLRPFACWDCGFESRRRHGSLSPLSVVCRQVEVSSTVHSLFHRSPTQCRGCRARKKNSTHSFSEYANIFGRLTIPLCI